MIKERSLHRLLAISHFESEIGGKTEIEVHQIWNMPYAATRHFES
jgi:hypothetical protein